MNSGADGVTPPKKSKMRPLSTSTPAARATSSREGETSHMNSSRNSNKNRGFKRKYNGLVQVSWFLKCSNCLDALKTPMITKYIHLFCQEYNGFIKHSKESLERLQASLLDVQAKLAHEKENSEKAKIEFQLKNDLVQLKERDLREKSEELNAAKVGLEEKDLVIDELRETIKRNSNEAQLQAIHTAALEPAKADKIRELAKGILEVLSG